MFLIILKLRGLHWLTFANPAMREIFIFLDSREPSAFFLQYISIVRLWISPKTYINQTYYGIFARVFIFIDLLCWVWSVGLLVTNILNANLTATSTNATSIILQLLIAITKKPTPMHHKACLHHLLNIIYSLPYFVRFTSLPKSAFCPHSPPHTALLCH